MTNVNKIIDVVKWEDHVEKFKLTKVTLMEVVKSENIEIKIYSAKTSWGATWLYYVVDGYYITNSKYNKRHKEKVIDSIYGMIKVLNKTK